MRDTVFQSLNERSKELNCLYRVLENLNRQEESLSYIFKSIIHIIPQGWQYPTVCVVRITYEDQIYKSEDFKETLWSHSADIVVDNNRLGKIEVFYTQFIRELHNSQFLPQEQKLLNTIADRISDFVFFRKLDKTLAFLQEINKDIQPSGKEILGFEQDEHWKWRFHVAKVVAGCFDKERFSAKALYLIGSTKQGNAGPASDIDFMVHLHENAHTIEEMKCWFEGWGLSLNELNYQKTGYQLSTSLIDLHIITDDDVKNKNSFASMIGAIDNPALKLC